MPIGHIRVSNSDGTQTLKQRECSRPTFPVDNVLVILPSLQTSR